MAIKRTRSDFEAPAATSLYTRTTTSYPDPEESQSHSRKRFYDGPSAFQHAFFAAQPAPSQLYLSASVPPFSLPTQTHGDNRGGASLPTSFSRSRQSSPASTTSSGCNTPSASHEIAFFSCEECFGDMMELDTEIDSDIAVQGGRGCEGCGKAVCGGCLTRGRCAGCKQEKEKERPGMVRRGAFLATGFRRNCDV